MYLDVIQEKRLLYKRTSFELGLEGLKRIVSWGKKIMDERTFLTKDTSDQEQVRTATKFLWIHSVG